MSLRVKAFVVQGERAVFFPIGMHDSLLWNHFCYNVSKFIF